MPVKVLRRLFPHDAPAAFLPIKEHIAVVKYLFSGPDALHELLSLFPAPLFPSMISGFFSFGTCHDELFAGTTPACRGLSTMLCLDTWSGVKTIARHARSVRVLAYASCFGLCREAFLLSCGSSMKCDPVSGKSEPTHCYSASCCCSHCRPC